MTIITNITYVEFNDGNNPVDIETVNIPFSQIAQQVNLNAMPRIPNTVLLVKGDGEGALRVASPGIDYIYQGSATTTQTIQGTVVFNKKWGLTTAVDTTTSTASPVPNIVEVQNYFSQLTTLFIGEIIALPISTAPAGFLRLPPSLTTVSIAQYPLLYAKIGTRYGGDGITTFGLPTIPNGYTLISADGQAAVTSSGSLISHTHSITDPGHVHKIGEARNVSIADVPSTIQVSPEFPDVFSASSTTGITINSTGGSDNLAAGLKVYYFIRALAWIPSPL